MRQPTGREPGPARIAIEDLLAKCPSNHARASLSQAIIWMALETLVEAGGREKGVEVLKAYSEEVVKGRAG